MSELETIYKEWWDTLVELATVFGTAAEYLRHPLTQRADSLRTLEKDFRGRVDIPRLQPADRVVGQIPVHGATERSVSALERLHALRLSAGGVGRLRGHHTSAERDFASRLNLRWHKLADLEKQLAAVNVPKFEMEATIPSVYYLTVLHETKDIRPRVGSEQARAIIALHRANIPAAYAAGVTTPLFLNPQAAEDIIGLYTEGIPSELAKELL